MNSVEFIKKLHEENTAPRYLERIESEEEQINLIKLLNDSNDPFDKFMLAFLYLDGLYLEQDINKAFELFKYSVEHNILRAYNNLGIITETYFNDPEQALVYYEKAWNEGEYVPALYNIGTLYENYFKDIDKAKVYYDLYEKNR